MYQIEPEIKVLGGGGMGRDPFVKGASSHKIFQTLAPLEQINFEMFHISSLSFCRKKHFWAESTLFYVALHSCAALECLNFFQS